MYLKRTVRPVLFVLVAASMVLAACAPSAATQAPPTAAAAQPTAPAAAQPTAPAAAQPTAAGAGGRKVSTFIWTQEFDTLNPLYSNMWFSQVTFQLWNCYAWNFDDQNQPVPNLVKEMPSLDNGGISQDGKTLTFHLRDDIAWTDGTPITSKDFAFTYQMTLDKKNAVATTAPDDKIDKFETPDDHTIVVTFKDPFAAWMGSMFHGLLPEHILKPVYDQAGTLDNAEWNRKPTVGCGPFKFEEWQSGSFARFVANDKYWLGKPKLDEIFFRFVPDDASQVAALKSGEGDIGTFIAYPDMPDLKKAGVAITVAFSGYNEGLYFLIDPEKGNPALQDVNVRQAIAMSIDREKITKDLLLGLTKPSATDWDNTPYVDPSIQPWPFDPEKAKQMLDAAGWTVGSDGIREKDGNKLKITYGTTTRQVRQDTQAVIQNQLKDVGIAVELSNYASDTFFNGYGQGGPAATGQLDMFEYSTVPSDYPDPNTAEWLCSEIPTNDKPTGTNWMRNCDKDLDALFQQETTQVDFKTRQETFYKITKMIFDKVYFLGLWQDPDTWAVSSRLQNVKLSGITPFFNIMEWDLKQ